MTNLTVDYADASDSSAAGDFVIHTECRWKNLRSSAITTIIALVLLLPSLAFAIHKPFPGFPVLVLCVLVVVVGLKGIVDSVLDYPRLSLSGNTLALETFVWPRRKLDLSTLGKAHACILEVKGRLSTSKATLLKFHRNEDEQALIAQGRDPTPTPSDSCKALPVNRLIGKDFGRAEDIAAFINRRRPKVHAAAISSGEAQRRLAKMGRRRRWVTIAALAIGVAAGLLVALMRHH